jgi:hypothetical protein
MGSITRQWSFNYPTSLTNQRSIPRCSTSYSIGSVPTFSGQYFRFKTISSYSANEIINALMNKMNPNVNPNNTYVDFHTNKFLFCSAVSRFIPYGPTDFVQWNIVIGIPQLIHFYDIDHFNLDSNCLGISCEKVNCDILDNEELAIREARALRYIFGNKCDNFKIYVENTENFVKGYDELIDFRNFEVTWNNCINSWRLTDLSQSKSLNINWFNIMIGSRILNKPKSFVHVFISKFFYKHKMKKVNVYTGKRHRVSRRRIYKTELIRTSTLEHLPYELCYDVFIKYVKDEQFEGMYSEIFKENGEDLLFFKGGKDN